MSMLGNGKYVAHLVLVIQYTVYLQLLFYFQAYSKNTLSVRKPHFKIEHLVFFF